MILRISKYNPSFRTNGIYQKQEWTSVFDIGRSYGGKRFTKKEYLETELRYVDCLLEIVSYCGKKPIIIDYEQHKELPLIKALFFSISLGDPWYYFKKSNWKRGEILTSTDARRFIIDCLREKCWGVLQLGTLWIDFGYDYYVHLQTQKPTEDIENIIRKQGLYYERLTIKSQGQK